MSLNGEVVTSEATAGPNWHRGYYIVRYLSGHALVILQADTKTYDIVFASKLDASLKVDRNVVHQVRCTIFDHLISYDTFCFHYKVYRFPINDCIELSTSEY
jgi:hypothetical protein